MISKMRQVAGIFVFIASIAFVATIFFDWGMDVTGRGQRPVVGSIEGKRIPLDAFDRMVNGERQRLQSASEGEVPPEQYRTVPRQVWERMVAERVLGATYENMKLQATADEMFAYLRSNPLPGADTAKEFRTNGVFDTAKWEGYLNRGEIWDVPAYRQLESELRTSVVPRMKLEALLRAGTLPSRLETMYELRQRTQRGAFQYAYVSSAAMRLDSAAIGEQAVRQYYEAHPDSFKIPEQVDLRFVTLPRAATPDDEAMYLQEMTDLRDSLAAGTLKFEEEAKALSDDPGSAVNGGELGWFGAGAMVPEFEKVAFSLKPGEVSAPLRTQFGYHVIQVEEKRTQDGKPQVRARHILRKISASVETLDSLKAVLDSLLVVADTTDLLTAAKAFPGVAADSTGLFARGVAPPKMGFVSGVSGWAFGAEPGSLGENVYENQQAYFAVELKRKVRAGVLPLEDARPAIVRTLSQQNLLSSAREHLAAAVTRSGGDIAGLSKGDSAIMSGTSDTVTAASYVPPLGYANEALAAAFAQPLGSVSAPVEVAGGVCVVKPLWRSPEDTLADAGPMSADLRRTLASAGQQRVFVEWYLAAKETARVKSSLDEYYSE